MNRQLNLEELGYNDARSNLPPAQNHPAYLEGYHLGQRDRAAFDGVWEAWQRLRASGSDSISSIQEKGFLALMAELDLFGRLELPEDFNDDCLECREI
jgi:hypothetical protein